MQDQAQKQIEALQAQLQSLKLRLFDMQEAAATQQDFNNQFFGQLAQILQLPEDQRNEPNAYLQAVYDLTQQQTGQTGESVDEPVPAVHELLAG